jgi:anti-sigma regulatory factor (Ser/Thr protein kinase)
MHHAQAAQARADEAAPIKLVAAGPERRKTSLGLLEAARFRCRTLEEAAALASFVAEAFPDPARAAKGLAELLCNAIEHGSLEIGYELKGVLLAQNAWRAEVDRRLSIEPYASRSVELVFTRKNGGSCVVITDEGPGFDWKRYLAVSPARASDRHGRGIAHVRARCFDTLSYNAKGDRVVAFTRGGGGLDW